MKQFFLGLGIGLGLATIVIHAQSPSPFGAPYYWDGHVMRIGTDLVGGFEPASSQISLGKGMQFNKTTSGPNYGPGLAGMAYRDTTGEQFADEALIIRAHAYAFESDKPQWMAILNENGLGVGIISTDKRSYPEARLHVRRGGLRLDSDETGDQYAELFSGNSADGKGSLWVRFPSGQVRRLADEQ